MSESTKDTKCPNDAHLVKINIVMTPKLPRSLIIPIYVLCPVKQIGYIPQPPLGTKWVLYLQLNLHLEFL